MPFHLFVDDVTQGTIDHLSDVGCRPVMRFVAAQKANRNAVVEIRFDGAADQPPLSHATGFAAPIDPLLRPKVRHGMTEHHIDGTTTFGYALGPGEVEP